MNATKCQSCNTPVNRREAVVRSVSLRTVHYHRVCWEKVNGPLVKVDTGRTVAA